MKASILIPAHNAARTLQATLESCIVQDRTAVEEVIVVDDHSTDNTEAVFAAFAEQHPDFSWVWATNPRKGACSARNHALELSRGEYIQWLDADDLLGQNKVAAQLNLLAQQDGAIAACPFRPFRGDPASGRIPDARDWNLKTDWNAAEWVAKDSMCIPACWLGSRRIMQDAGPWNESLHVNQDGEYFCRVLARCGRVLFDDSVEVFYRREGGGVSRFTDEKADSLFRSVQSMEKTALQLEASQRMRQMVSNRYQTFIYTAYPTRPDLLRAAEARLRELPPPTISNPNAVSLLSRAISATLGWKALTRLRLMRQSLTS